MPGSPQPAPPAAAPAAGRKRPRRRAGRGVLLLISGFLFASGALRLAGDSGHAIALEIGALVARAEASAQGGPAEDTPGFENLLTAVRAREARVAQAEADLAAREQALAIAREELDRGLAAMAEAEANLEELLRLADTAADEDVARLTAMYEAMKPAEAAAVFDQMDPQFAAGFLGRMRSDAAAQVLAGLPPDKAYALSVVLAGRNAGAQDR
jgi:flagellar motility protein MotE (MotC chaperone)